MALIPLRGLVPIAHVEDVQRSIGKTHLMLARSARPMKSGAQDVLFYLYAPDVARYRAELAVRGIIVGPLTYPAYMPEGEFHVDDPDGYCLLVGQSDEVSL